MRSVCPACGGTFAGTDRFCQQDGSRLLPADESDPLLGQTVGSYRIAVLLGAGGMGRVYMGVHPTIGSRVAIKVLSHDLSRRRELVDRFFAEAQLVNRIRHEGIVNVLDVSSLPDGRPYIVMELLDGESLAALLARHGPLEPAHAAAILGPLLDALAAAHERGVVHRDLKPDNVFLTRHGRVVVLDFGIAKLLPEMADGPERLAPATKTGAVLGTPGYMAPEQVQGRPPSPATDIYAAGIILYQALGGRLPFDGDSLFEIMQKHVAATPVALRQLRPEISPELDAVVLRAMAKDPALRFASARHMAEALGAALHVHGAGWRASAANADAGARPRAPRAGLLVGLGVGGVLAAAFVLLAVFAPTDEPTSSPPRAVAVDNVAVIDAAPAAATTAATAGEADRPAAEVVGAKSAADEIEEPTSEPRSRAGSRSRPRVASRPGGTGSPAASRSDSSSGSDSSSDPEGKSRKESEAGAGVSQIGGVTIINTAEKVRSMTGLEPIAAVPESSGGSFDPLRTLVQAEGMAKKLMPDVVLVGIDIDHARPDGRALMRADSGATYRFRSPSRSKRPAGQPRNIEVDIPCMVHVSVVRGRIEATPVTDEECDAARLARPRCAVTDLWRRAREQGAPRSGDWVARISYMRDGWFIDIPKAGTPPFEDFTLSLPDDCRP